MSLISSLIFETRCRYTEWQCLQKAEKIGATQAQIDILYNSPETKKLIDGIYSQDIEVRQQSSRKILELPRTKLLIVSAITIRCLRVSSEDLRKDNKKRKSK